MAQVECARHQFPAPAVTVGSADGVYAYVAFAAAFDPDAGWVAVAARPKHRADASCDGAAHLVMDLAELTADLTDDDATAARDRCAIEFPRGHVGGTPVIEPWEVRGHDVGLVPARQPLGLGIRITGPGGCVVLPGGEPECLRAVVSLIVDHGDAVVPALQAALPREPLTGSGATASRILATAAESLRFSEDYEPHLD